jgi:hypothetical protein
MTGELTVPSGAGAEANTWPQQEPHNRTCCASAGAERLGRDPRCAARRRRIADARACWRRQTRSNSDRMTGERFEVDRGNLECAAIPKSLEIEQRADLRALNASWGSGDITSRLSGRPPYT